MHFGSTVPGKIKKVGQRERSPALMRCVFPGLVLPKCSAFWKYCTRKNKKGEIGPAWVLAGTNAARKNAAHFGITKPGKTQRILEVLFPEKR
jgi:hypothetical protein